MNYATEIYIWNQAEKNNIIISSNTPSWPQQVLVCICPLDKTHCGLWNRSPILVVLEDMFYNNQLYLFDPKFRSHIG